MMSPVPGTPRSEIETRSAAVPLWQRLLITLATMIVTSFVAGLLWRAYLNAAIPPYLGGLVGGATAVPVWELLKRIEVRPRR